MSSDLLAEFDSFYQAPQKNQSASSAANDLSFLSDLSPAAQPQYGSGQPSSQWQNTSTNNSIWGDMASFTQPSSAQTMMPAQSNIWDAFGTTSEPSSNSQQSFVSSQQTPSALQKESGSRPVLEAKQTADLFSSDFASKVHSVPSQTKTPQATQPSKQPAPSKDPTGDVLFDADEEVDDDDDFGDFETVTTPMEAAPQQIDQLFGATSLEEKHPDPETTRPTSISFPPPEIISPLPYPHAPISPSFKERNPFADLGLTTDSIKVKELKKANQIPSAASPITAWPTFQPQVPKEAPFQDSPNTANVPDDDWGDFADLPAETPGEETNSMEDHARGWDRADKVSTRTPASKKTTIQKVSKTVAKSSGPSVPPKVSSTPPAPVPTPKPVPVPAKVIKKDVLPPTNIPPPSVLLTLFPPLFDLPQSKLFKPVSDQPFSLKNRIMSDPGTVKFLRAYILIATVAARIIAGRKLRWKRDGHLSQAMKIGPAAAKGRSGMKLTGVDKAETTRENREVSDVVRIWKEQLGRLKSAVAAANSSNHDILSHIAIPDIGEVMHVNTLKGAMTDAKACLLCGLKREERVSNVDIDELIEDSFGEWWIGYWGHRDCRNFWEENQAKLKFH